jgi:hypothetical protein
LTPNELRNLEKLDTKRQLAESKLVKLENNLKTKRTLNIMNTQAMKRAMIGEIKPILS